MNLVSCLRKVNQICHGQLLLLFRFFDFFDVFEVIFIRSLSYEAQIVNNRKSHGFSVDFRGKSAQKHRKNQKIEKVKEIDHNKFDQLAGDKKRDPYR